MSLRIRSTSERSTYMAGFKAGSEAMVERLRQQFPDIDDPEFGGPIRELTEWQSSLVGLLEGTEAVTDTKRSSFR